jgi:type IV pilus assembly protein PilY1
MTATAITVGRRILGLAAACAIGAHAATTDIANAPLVTSSPSTVLPNLMFVLDDSGSMSSDFLPDWADDPNCRASGATSTNTGTFNAACGSPPKALFRAAAYNGQYYNPAFTYSPPVDSTGASYVSETSANTVGWTKVKNDGYGIQSTSTTNLLTSYVDIEYCTDGTYTDCLRNDNYVLPGTVSGKSYTTLHSTTATGTGVFATGAPDAPTTTATQPFGPHYYTIVPGEFCTGVDLRTCQPTQTAAYNVPAPLRWCNSDANARAASPAANTCQAVQTSTFLYARFPTKFFNSGTVAAPAVAASVTFTLSMSGCSNSKKAGVATVMVNGVNLLGGQTNDESSANNLAQDIRNNISAAGYTASGSSNSVTITAPVSAGAITYAVSLTRTASSNAACTFAMNPATPKFSGYTPATTASPAGWYGSFKRTDIVASVATYPKATSRTDCTTNATTCTYAEEMTNFANWWAYYKTRMQAMKTSATRAFAPLSNQFRIGYMSINNNTGSDFRNVAQFQTSDKAAWFTKFTSAKPNNSTPLRTALSTVGKYYANKLDKINTVSTTDPVQYSCQQNFTLLSTDGYWNETTDPTRLDGATLIGDQDNALPRPYLDGKATANTLADVAAYYYNTDLRTSALGNCTGAMGADVCDNQVPTTPTDVANYQHMTTFTMGLGASGFMQFRPDYITAGSGDYFAVKNGSAADPANGICMWQASGVCNWPVPVSNTLTAIDDLWHAAINGHGTYFSATDPGSMYTGLTSALNSLQDKLGAAAAATTSNPNVSAGDNFIFSSSFRSQEWTGQLQRRQIDVNTAAISNTVDWSAEGLLDANSSRTLYTFDALNATNHRKPFAWASLSASEQAYFQSTYMNAAGPLSQFCSFGSNCLSPTSQADAQGAKLLAFIAGDRSNEGPASDTSTYFRQRVHVLGDIVDSEATYVKVPKFDYSDAGYGAFKTSNANRTGIVYVGANDGMLHAFDAATGEETWAYIPRMLLGKLYRLADKNYGNQHTFFVDGSPVASDVYFGGQWHTILVGGLGAGGRGYYAIDVTTPNDPHILWEFSSDTDADLGLTLGKPEVTKLKDGTWVVIFASGYNNVSPGSGHGILFVLNAATGAVIRKIDTGAGSTGTPAGLAQIRAWVDTASVDNTALRVYSGDNLGNVWRFDINGDIGAAGYDAQLLATLTGPSGNVQPVTARPELAQVKGQAVVYVGTGRYLGTSDLSDSSVQSIYAIKDKLGTTSYGSPRLSTNSFVQQVLTDSVCPASSTFCTPGRVTRTGTSNAVDITVNDGWFVDLPASRERANTDPQLTLGTLVFTTNVLDPSACIANGYSFINFFDYTTGAPIPSTDGIVSLRSDYLTSRPDVACTAGGTCKEYVQPADGEPPQAEKLPINPPSTSTRRTSWRELPTE